MTNRKLRMGVAGLGRAFTVMLPTLTSDPRVELVAAADPRPETRRAFAADFGARTFPSVEELCDYPEIEVVYVATPHHLHSAHVCAAARKGKHVLVEKPIASSLEDAFAMLAAAREARVHLLVGHSHSFDLPIRRTHEIVTSGAVGKVQMITALNFTDFLYRPRRPEELLTEKGGGVAFSQAAHQIDIVRLLGGGLVRSVRAASGSWDPERPTEGAYAAFLRFAGGVFASAVYSGYAHFDSDEFCGWIGERGYAKQPEGYAAAREMLRRASTASEEATLKAARNYGGAQYSWAAAVSTSEPPLHEHFGLVIVSCERADLRPLPTGVMIYGDADRQFEALPKPKTPRKEVIDELYDTVVLHRAPVHSGPWALATLEVCLAILRSAREQKEIFLEHQIAVSDEGGRARSLST
jgi:phthalate 4,5-cis-dihydrodiol dehydrogenase